MYGPYRGCGPHGRHNREYNKHEFYLLFNYLGFNVDEMCSANVYEIMTNFYFDPSKFEHPMGYRKHNLAHHIFIRARKTGEELGERFGLPLV